MLNLKSLILAVIFVITSSVQAQIQNKISLDQFLQQALNETEDFQALDKSLKSVQFEIEARELQLATQLQLSASGINDHKDSFTQYFNRETQSQVFGVTLAQPFSTGTNLSLETQYEIAQLDSAGNKLYRADWAISLTQDLWRNSFGRSVRLRRQSDQAELENRQFNLLLQKQQLINTLENLYWDYALNQKELSIRQENLKRSEQILAWTHQRVRVSAARDTDLLQVQALLSSRKLELADVERAAVSLKNQIDQMVPSLSHQNWITETIALEKERDLNLLRAGAQKDGTPQLISNLAAQYKVKQLQAQSESTRDQLYPSLQLQLSHSQNGIRPDSQEAVDRALGNNKTDLNRIGLIFSMNLDLGLTSKSRDSAQMAAEAAALQAQRLQRSSDFNWTDLEAQVLYLKKSLQLSMDLMNYQKKNIESERRYFQQGRNTVFEFINYEITAADAELRYYRVLSQMRKTEAAARLFTVDQKVSL